MSLRQHAVAITPVGPESRIARASCLHSEEALCSLTAAFPDLLAGRLPHRPFRGLLDVHFALRPAWLAESPRRSFPSKAPTVLLPPPPLRLLPAGATSCRAGLSPAGTSTLSWRTEDGGLTCEREAHSRPHPPRADGEWSREVARWFRCGLAVAGSFVCRCLNSLTMLRFHLPLIEPDGRFSRIRLSDKDALTSVLMRSLSREVAFDRSEPY